MSTMKLEEIQNGEQEDIDTEELSNVLDTSKRKQEILCQLDEDIIKGLDGQDMETEIMESDEYAFNLETKISKSIQLFQMIRRLRNC